MTAFDPERFMNEPNYAFDFGFMIGGIRAFLEFSEANVESQHRRERRSIQQRADSGEWNLPDEYRYSYLQHLLENAEHWFTVGLPLQIRYGALLSLTTAVEWSIGRLAERLTQPISNQSGCNQTVHRLCILNKRANLGKADSIDNYKALVEVRNCIAHTAGLEKGYRQPNMLKKSLDRLEGFYLGNWHFYGTHICVEREALEPYIDEVGEIVRELHRAAHKQALLKRT